MNFTVTLGSLSIGDSFGGQKEERRENCQKRHKNDAFSANRPRKYEAHKHLSLDEGIYFEFRVYSFACPSPCLLNKPS